MTLLDTALDTAPQTLTDAEIVALAAEMGRVAAEHDAAHDRDATFVTEAYDAMHAAGYLRLAVPDRPRRAGATMRQLVLAQHELGKHSGAAALRRRCTTT